MKCISLFFALWGIGAGTLFFASWSLAEPSASDKETARTLLLEGRTKMADKDYAAAREKFKIAHDIMRVPTTGLDLAKAEEALGLLVEARSTALEVTRLAPEPDSEAYVNARATADELAKQLLLRIPSLVIKVNVPAGVTATATVDGSRIPPSALGSPRKVNPGHHAVLVTATGYIPDARTVTLKEGETRTIEVALTRTAPVAAPASARQVRVAEKSANVPGWTWASSAGGVVALGAGIGFAVDFSEAKRELYKDCPNARCRPGVTSGDGEVMRARWNRDVGLMVTFLGSGAIGVGAGIVGIVMASAREKQRTETALVLVIPWAGPDSGGAVLTGKF